MVVCNHCEAPLTPRVFWGAQSREEIWSRVWVGATRAWPYSDAPPWAWRLDYVRYWCNQCLAARRDAGG